MGEFCGSYIDAGLPDHNGFCRTHQMTELISSPSVDEREVERFARIAGEWWDPHGKFRPLHQFNPVRLGFIRSVAAEHFNLHSRDLRPFGGLSLLDIGCGGGLLSEPMARLGFQVTGVDASERNVRAALTHASGQGLAINYRATAAELLVEEGVRFDVILNMEVVEHVADVELFLGACARLLKPGVLMFVATINRTVKSLLLAKIAAEYVLRWIPAGTHDWHRLITPAELRHQLEKTGLNVARVQGMNFDPLGWKWRLSHDTDVNYTVVATKV
jgi:2-polyprenyl-6-hydroxyphenyl methylase/3-demethylubiquinone-9 3-methyltransferase